MTTDLIIMGAGGFARETVSAIAAINERVPTFRPLGFLDDDPALHGTRRADLPVLGGSADLDRWPDAAVVVCVGSPRAVGARMRVVRRLALPAERYATIVHPSAGVGVRSVIGPGSVLLAGVVLTADVRVGAHVAVMPHTVLTHDDVIADGATLASGVRLGGGVHLDEGCYLGAGALLREGVRVGAGALVGMGAVVLRDVPAGQVWAGNPARPLRRTEAEAEAGADAGAAGADAVVAGAGAGAGADVDVEEGSAG